MGTYENIKYCIFWQGPSKCIQSISVTLGSNIKKSFQMNGHLTHWEFPKKVIFELPFVIYSGASQF